MVRNVVTKKRRESLVNEGYILKVENGKKRSYEKEKLVNEELL